MTDTFKSGDLVRLTMTGQFVKVHIWSTKDSAKRVSSLNHNSIALVVAFINESLLLLVNESVGWVHDPNFLGIKRL